MAARVEVQVGAWAGPEVEAKRPGGGGGAGGGGKGAGGGGSATEGGGEGGTATGGGYVDAGYYYGDGSFFVDGGAYPDLPDGSSQGGTDAGVIDAAPGCGALAACCASLQSASQALCSDVVAQGNATNRATELTQLQGEGDCTGVSILAPEGQVPANELVSDGRLLFWTTSQT